MNQLSKEEPGDVAGVELGQGREAAPVPGKAAVTRAELDLRPLPSQQLQAGVGDGHLPVMVQKWGQDPFSSPVGKSHRLTGREILFRGKQIFLKRWHSLQGCPLVAQRCQTPHGWVAYGDRAPVVSISDRLCPCPTMSSTSKITGENMSSQIN